MTAALTDTERKWSRMRLIDADALKETIDREIFRHDTIDHVFQIIDDAPTIEPKRGEWISTTSGEHWKCSACGYRAPFWFNEENSCEWSLDMSEWLSDFCPNCGARMKGADDDD